MKHANQTGNFFRFEAMGCLELSGKDAPDFLHRLTTANTKRMPVGKAVRSLLLTGSSQVIAEFVLLRLEAERFWLVASADIFPLAQAHLEKMHFSEAMEQRILENCAVRSVGACLDEIQVSDSSHNLVPGFFEFRRVEMAGGERVAWPELGAMNFGMLFFGAPGKNKGAIAGEFAQKGFREDPNPDFWLRERILARKPEWQREWNGDSRALDIGFLAWIDRNKGCYPGQEVVEKSLNVGHPARQLVLVRADAAHAADCPQALASEGRELGQLTSFSAGEGSGIGLAVVRWEARIPGTKLSGRDSQGRELRFTVEGE